MKKFLAVLLSAGFILTFSACVTDAPATVADTGDVTVADTSAASDGSAEPVIIEDTGVADTEVADTDVTDTEVVAGELDGTFLDETGTTSLTFSGGSVTLAFPSDDYSTEGTYEAVDGMLTFHFDDETISMSDAPTPYEITDGNLVLDGTVYVKQ